MIQEQLIPAFIAQLLIEEVDPLAIERAVLNVKSLRLGASFSNGNPVYRAFAFEQSALLERAIK